MIRIVGHIRPALFQGAVGLQIPPKLHVKGSGYIFHRIWIRLISFVGALLVVKHFLPGGHPVQIEALHGELIHACWGHVARCDKVYGQGHGADKTVLAVGDNALAACRSHRIPHRDPGFLPVHVVDHLHGNLGSLAAEIVIHLAGSNPGRSSLVSSLIRKEVLIIGIIKSLVNHAGALNGLLLGKRRAEGRRSGTG